MNLLFAYSLTVLSTAFGADPNSDFSYSRQSYSPLAGVRTADHQTSEERIPEAKPKPPKANAIVQAGGTDRALRQPGTLFNAYPNRNETGIYFGYESVIVKPFFDNNMALSFDNVLGAPPTRVSVQEFDWNLVHSPRIWLGYGNSSGLGFQVRYWQFDHSQSLTTIDVAGDSVSLNIDFDSTSSSFGIATADAGERILARQRLALHVTDAEATWRSVPSGRGSVVVTGGIRHVSLTDDFSIRTFTVAGAFDQEFRRKRKFDGTGPTVSLFGRWPLAKSGFAVFINGRLSALYGKSELDAVDIEITGTEDIFRQSSNDLVSVLELQWGGEWSRRIKRLSDARLLLRLGLEGQVWYDVASDDIDTFNTDGTLGFFGLLMAAGLVY